MLDLVRYTQESGGHYGYSEVVSTFATGLCGEEVAMFRDMRGVAVWVDYKIPHISSKNRGQE